ncbi:MAG: 2-polyprenyl-6-methoxyphenol hydroxylase [Cyclobacteriaceae bacterium]
MATKNFIISGLLLMLSFSFLSCSSENEDDLLPEERCEEQPASLSGDVIPIINQNCAVSGCHVSGSNRVNLSVKENILQYANQIRNFTQSGYMPRQGSGLTLSDSEKETIFCWVENGAMDN